MSPTSSERRPRPNTSFRRAFAITVAALALLCIALLAVSSLQGPRLQEGQLDAAAATATEGTQLRLFLNQSIAQVRPEQVSIEPQTAIEISTRGDVLAVQFEQRLQYATEYRVTVEGVTSPYLAQPSTIEYAFTTPSPTVTWLDRGEPDDVIRSVGLDGGAAESLFSGPGIQDFALADGILAVVSLADDRTSAIDLVSLSGPAVERLSLPEPAVVRNFEASGSLLGFTLTSAEQGAEQVNNQTLYTIDLSGDRTPQPVLGIDGEPLDVLGWAFLPGSRTLVALSIDRTLLLITDGVATPLGSGYQELVSVAADGDSLVLIDAGGPLVLSLADGSESPVTTSPIDGREPFAGETQLLPDGTRIGKALLVDATGTRFSTLLIRDDGTESSVLYRTIDDRGSIEGFRVSPNGQYVAIEVIPDFSASVSDGYYYDARSTSVTTVIVEVATGRELGTVEGFGLLWG